MLNTIERFCTKNKREIPIPAEIKEIQMNKFENNNKITYVFN